MFSLQTLELYRSRSCCFLNTMRTLSKQQPSVCVLEQSISSSNLAPETENLKSCLPTHTRHLSWLCQKQVQVCVLPGSIAPRITEQESAEPVYMYNMPDSECCHSAGAAGFAGTPGIVWAQASKAPLALRDIFMKWPFPALM